MANIFKEFLKLLGAILASHLDTVHELRKLNVKGDILLSKFDDLLTVVGDVSAAANSIATATAAVAAAVQSENSELATVIQELKDSGTDTAKLDTAIANLNGLTSGLSDASAKLQSVAQFATASVAAAVAADPNTPPATPTPAGA